MAHIDSMRQEPLMAENKKSVGREPLDRYDNCQLEYTIFSAKLWSRRNIEPQAGKARTRGSQRSANSAKQGREGRRDGRLAEVGRDRRAPAELSLGSVGHRSEKTLLASCETRNNRHNTLRSMMFVNPRTIEQNPAKSWDIRINDPGQRMQNTGRPPRKARRDTEVERRMVDGLWLMVEDKVQNAKGRRQKAEERRQREED
jgi:hypothetical protein